MSHSQVSDEQLILCYRQNSKEAYDILLKRKHHDVLPLLKKYANQCKPFGVEMNDLYAVYLESFHKFLIAIWPDSFAWYQTPIFRVITALV